MKTLKSLAQEHRNTKFGSLFIICIYCETKEESHSFLQQAEKKALNLQTKLCSQKTGRQIYFI